MKQAYRIDELGYYKEPAIVDIGEEIPNDCVEMQPPHGLYRAKWTGTEWIEDMTQEEIDELNNQPTEQLVLQQKDLAIKLLVPTLPDEALIQVPLLFDEWVSGVEYVADKSVVRYGDDLFRVITSHKSQADWTPDVALTLFSRISRPGEILAWKQGSYTKGTKVTHKGFTWESVVDNNVWEPGAVNETIWKKIV